MMPQYLCGTSSLEAIDSTFMTREEIFQSLRQNLEKTQLRTKKCADTHRKDVHFNKRDWLYVKIQPYRQNQLWQDSLRNFQKEFLGCFKSFRK